jgi:hypothetical protein
MSSTVRYVAHGMLFAFVVCIGCAGSVVRATADASAVGDGGGEGGSGGDGAYQCSIQASAYDISCKVDSDCVSMAGNFPVAFGNFYCTSDCLCPSDAISRGAVAQYVSDVSRTPWGSGAMARDGCLCGLSLGPCCLAGQCSVACSAELPCSRPPCSTSGTDSGTPDSGAADSEVLPVGSVLCASRLGLVDAGVVDGGVLYQCVPPQSCTQFNGGWACCMSINPQEVICAEFDAATSP